MTSRSPSNTIQHEIIGLQVEVSSSSDPSIVGMKGWVMDETKKMFCIHDGNRSRLLSKQISTFRFRLPDGKHVLIQGKRMVSQPENRLKIKTRSW